MPLPVRVRERMTAGLKRFVPIILQQKARDVSEPDTVTLVKDVLADVLGYDKYAEVTSEHAIRGTYCDLAVKLAEKLVMLIEVKSAGTPLDDRHVKQAIDYASNQGCDWVVLTNGSLWRLYQVIFAKPIDKRLVAEIDVTAIETKKEEHLERFWPLTKEGFSKGAHLELRDRQDATSRYVLSALLTCNDTVVSTIRRELRRVVDVLVDDAEIVKALQHEVIKRDTLEGPEAEAACRRVSRKERDMKAARKPRGIDGLATKTAGNGVSMDGDAETASANESPGMTGEPSWHAGHAARLAAGHSAGQVRDDDGWVRTKGPRRRPHAVAGRFGR